MATILSLQDESAEQRQTETAVDSRVEQPGAKRH